MKKKPSKNITKQPPIPPAGVFNNTRGQRQAGIPIPRIAERHDTDNIVDAQAAQNNNNNNDEIPSDLDNSATIDASAENNDLLLPSGDETQQEEETSTELQRQFNASTMTKPTLDAGMLILVEDVLGWPINHEVVDSLIAQGYNWWDDFLLMDLTECDDLEKPNGKGGFVPCMKATKKKIERFIQYRYQKQMENDPNSPWKDITSYSEDEFYEIRTTFPYNSIQPAPAKKSFADDKALET